MSTLITTAILLLLALWATAVYARLLRLRKVVTMRWRDVGAARKHRDDLAGQATPPDDARDDLSAADHAVEQARLRYNLMATKYNEAITSIPGNIVAGLAGFKRADFLTPSS
jgi:hypothetical protein